VRSGRFPMIPKRRAIDGHPDSSGKLLFRRTACGGGTAKVARRKVRHPTLTVALARCRRRPRTWTMRAANTAVIPHPTSLPTSHATSSAKCTLRTIAATWPRPSRSTLGRLPPRLPARRASSAQPCEPSLDLSNRPLLFPLLFVESRERPLEGCIRALAQPGLERGLQGGTAERRGGRHDQRDKPEGGHGSRAARDPLAMPQLASPRLVDSP
jgi:hypothetical protein